MHNAGSSADASAAVTPELLLLRVAFADDALAIKSWKQWFTDQNYNDSGHTSYELFPLVYKRLNTLEVDSSGIQHRLKGICRHTYAQNIGRLQSVVRIFNSFLQAGADAVLIGDAAQALLHDHQPGVRGIQQIRILVRGIDVNHIDPVVRSAMSEQSLRRSGGSIDSRRYLLEEKLSVVISTQIYPHDASRLSLSTWFEQTLQRDIAGSQLSVPNQSLQLFYCLSMGRKLLSPKSHLWMADTASLISSKNICWEDVARFSAQYSTSMAVIESLQLCNSAIPGLVPNTAIQLLASLPEDYLELEITAGPAADNSLASRMGKHLRRYRQAAQYSRQYAGIGCFRYIIDYARARRSS